MRKIAPIKTLTADTWCRLRSHVHAGLDRLGGTHNEGDILHLLEQGRLTMWAGDDSFVFTEVNAYPRAREIRIFLAGGDWAEIQEMEPRICGYGKLYDCRHAVTLGRPGFERRGDWKDHGYKLVGSVYRKDLTDG